MLDQYNDQSTMQASQAQDFQTQRRPKVPIYLRNAPPKIMNKYKTIV